MNTIAYAALWVYVFSVPWGSVVILTSGVNLIGRLTGMLALAVALLAATVNGRIRRLHPFHIAALLFVMWAGVTQMLFVHAGDRLSSKYWTFIQLVLVTWMMWEIALSKRANRGLLLAYVLGASVVAADTIRVAHTQAGLMRRYAAGDADPNGVAMMLALALPMAWYLGNAYRQPALRWLSRAYLPLGIVAIGLTGSRGGMLATVVALLIVPLSMTRLTPGRFASAIALLGLAGTLAVVYVPDKIVQRLATTGSEVEELRLGGRFSIWVAGAKAFVHRPVMGYGTGAFKGAVAPYGITQVAHNSFLSVLVEQGLVGLLLYLSMLVAVFLAVRRLPRPERRFALVLLATLVVAMLPLTWEDNKVVWFVLPVLLGLARAERHAVPVAPPLRVRARTAPPAVTAR